MSAGKAAPTVGQACDARPEGAPKGALSLIHRNNCSNPIGMRVSSVLTMPVEAWEQGFKDGQLGYVDCPYPNLSRDAWAWSSGYIEGRANGKNTH